MFTFATCTFCESKIQPMFTSGGILVGGDTNG